MPHLVTTFLRNSSTQIEASVANLKKATVRRPSPLRSSSSSIRRTNNQRTFSYASSLGDDDTASDEVPYTESPAQTPQAAQAAHTAHSTHSTHTAPAAQSPRLNPRKMQRSSSAERREAADHHHRLSFGGLHFGRSSRESHGNPNLSIEWKIESPPIVLHNDPESSTGALVSGLLFLHVKEESVNLDSFSATLSMHTTQKRPYTAHCADCANQYEVLEKWPFVQGPMTLTKGEHGFPFSVLLPGHLPPSMDGQLVNIAYEFHAEAVPAPGHGLAVKFEKTFDVKRSLPAPELPHHSVRIFPPTNIKASVHFPQVIYPIGQNTLSLRIDGVARLNAKVNTLEFWKLKKLTWRIEETAKTIAPACAKHMPAEHVEPETEDAERPKPKKGTQRTDTRVIGEKTLLSGWKSNYAGPDDSSVELELDYMLAKLSKYSCDTKTRDGTEVTHQLMLEMVVSQEWAPANKPAMVTQTGVGRILRMHFTDVLTERGGIGVSWDNEAPPIYQDVPPSPPSYCDELDHAAIPDYFEPLDSLEGRAPSP
ncbi:lmbr1 domain-containing protein [Ophiostoma piceae UAMH 11346]|uniref:Lmbr1 domain-containing protein n=1 Tax=Ophiostoma piceae (strain UAMH 11346) TaxID=1262450 RepID=S3CXH5_OPHP1|nr:lmbr1 domain-containing protein [Ophiostoma piceae UAMH 11346]